MKIEEIENDYKFIGQNITTETKTRYYFKNDNRKLYSPKELAELMYNKNKSTQVKGN